MQRLEAAWLERTWIDLKQNKYVYGLNKLISFGVAAGLAAFTISIRAKVKKGQVLCETEDYKFLFWMLFVFYSFQALGELYEGFLQYNQSQERGIIGLLFELNYFCGIYVTYRVV